MSDILWLFQQRLPPNLRLFPSSSMFEMSNDGTVIIDKPSGLQSNEKGHDRLRASKFRLRTSRFSKTILLILIIAAALYVLLGLLLRAANHVPISPPLPRYPSRPVPFYVADNDTGCSSYVVPNVIHFVRFGQPNVSFMDAVSMRSAYINHAPDKIVVHCDECQLGGPLAYLIRDIPNLTIKEQHPAKTIFGREVGCIYHASDIARLQILLEYGGIFIDNDCVVINPLHPLRHYEMALGWSKGMYMASMVLLAAPGARFIRLHLELYREYNSSLWYYNVGDLPTMRLLWPHPHLIHAVPVLLGTDLNMLDKLYVPGHHPDWRSYFAVHTLIRHRCVEEDPLYGHDIDLQNVLFGTSAFVSNDTEVRPVADLYAARRRRRVETVANKTE
ncbi:uncharacterized protein LOC135368925 isoform X2 [Ornithodoros turicata]|uniref:uncharacterized protein LOC135368925 isoform X2 n=1 Tax=Ornithodoros turicata TaxID=34597 RepID=UPI0031392944